MALPPLAERMRPRHLDDFVGQTHLTGPEGILRRAITSGNLPSMVLWGPPGVGKTTLARLMALESGRRCLALSAIQSGVKDIRASLDEAGRLREEGQPAPVLFIDEIHRFNKAQQDALLGAVEQGTVILIGATTENPSFEVNNALLSRCQVYVLEPLGPEDLREMTRRALGMDDKLSSLDIHIEEEEAILHLSGGDGRRLYNILELVTQDAGPREALTITNDRVMSVVQTRLAQFDKDGEQHYDTISAFIKSVRGSDPNAALYYLARMIQGGEDPLFIARRMIILAAEDIGLANPNALLLANAAFDSCHRIGFPEARIILAEAAVYLACSPKSHSAYRGIEEALRLVRETGDQPVPLHLRNAATGLMTSFGYGKNYQYAHDHPGHFVVQDYLPTALGHPRLYDPGTNPAEEKFRQLLANHWGGKYDY